MLAMTMMRILMIKPTMMNGMLILLRTILMVLMKLFKELTPGGPRSTIAYPGRDPRFHMTKLNWIQTSLICKDMLLAAATATILFSSVIAMFFIDFPVFNRKGNSSLILTEMGFQV